SSGDVSRDRQTGVGLSGRIVRSAHRNWEWVGAMSMQIVGNVSSRGARRGAGVATAVALSLLSQAITPAWAGPAEQAQRIYERIAGVPPSAATLTTMTNDIVNQSGQAGLLAAAAEATK